ncbi:MAG: helix-turn-helix transcriptional regulator [Alphaproteobacteria bacterium]|nr:helix-turn-helix transcriptional regulator [Alphaproteobacteria bacterium]
MVKFLAKRIDQLKPDLTQREIAHRLGYRCVDFVSMFKTGAARVPLEKLPALADILEVDPAYLVRFGLEQY